jgi:hypothetical protein
MRAWRAVLFFPLFSIGVLAAQTTYAPRTIAPGAGTVAAKPHSAPTAPASFQIVDQLPHQDDFWQNMLVGDANHNGRQEIVLHHVPVFGARVENQVAFYQDDGRGQFHGAYSFPLDDGGLLAIGDVDDDGLTDLFFERAIGICNHEFVRWESSSPDGFPDHEVWSAKKEGNVVDFKAFIADTDGDGLKELVTGDSNFSCLPTSLKVFESAPGDQMTLIHDQVIGGNFGNPVVADFDQDGKREILVADFSGVVHDFEAVADNTFALLPTTEHDLFNAYQAALIDRFSPDGRPMLLLAGQRDSLDYRVQVYERMAPGEPLGLVNEVEVPSLCGASIPQIDAADLVGTRVPEVVVDRLCNPVPILSVGAGGALTLLETPMIEESLEVVLTTRTRRHSGAIAIGTFPTAANPEGKTLVLEME